MLWRSKKFFQERGILFQEKFQKKKNIKISYMNLEKSRESLLYDYYKIIYILFENV